MKAKATEKLSEILGEGIDVHRCAAAQALGAIKAPQTASILVKSLLDEDPDVRVDAATALGQFNDLSSAQPLMENLVGDPEADVKVAAIKALTAMRFMPLVPHLKKLAVSRSEEDFAWDEEAFYQDGWDSWVDVQLEAINALGSFGLGEGVAEISSVLDADDSDDIDEACYRALALMGESGASALEARYGVAGLRVRRRIARAVGKSENPHLENLLGDMLKDDSAQIRITGIQASLRESEALVPLFADADETVRAEIVRHAGIKNVPLLWDMINDDSSPVRVEVFKVIAAQPDEFKDKELLKEVKKAIAGEPKAATQAAIALVALIGAKAANGLTHVLGNADIPKDFRIGVIEALQNAGDVSVPAFLQAAGDEDRALRLASMTALAGLAADNKQWPNEAGTGLLSALKGELILPPEVEEEPEVEKEPAAELPPISDEMAQEIDAELPLKIEPDKPMSTLDAIKANKPDIPVEEPEEIVLTEQEERLVKLAHSHRFSKRKITLNTVVAPHLDVRRFSASLLGGLVQDDVTESLIEALSGEVEDYRDEVLFSLAKHGEATGTLPEAALEPLQALLESPSSETRVLAVRAYGYLEDDFVEATLEAMLSNQDELVRVEAIHALAHRGIADEGITDALKDSYLGVGIAAARALARIKGAEAVDDLVSFAVANDGTYRREIGRLLGQYAPTAGATALLALLEDTSRKTEWLVAIDALAELFQQPEPTGALKAA